MKKISLITIALFIGCGNGSNTSTSYKIEGKVVDGYVKNAIVCADINKNFRCDKNEPKTISDKNGNYTLITTTDNFILISTGGVDTKTNTPAITMYSLPKYKNITPLTTLAVKEGEDKVATYFNIKPQDISKDPMKDNEIQNIVINIVNEIKTKGKFELSPIPSIPTIPLLPDSNFSEENTKDTNISSKKTIPENDDIPPQITGDLTPPKIGE